MKTIKLTKNETITIINILTELADGDEVYMGYTGMDDDRKELEKIIKKLEKYI